MPYPEEMIARLYRSPVAKLGQIILKDLSSSETVHLDPLENLSRETNLQAVDTLTESDRYRDISIDVIQYGSIQCTWLNREKADQGVLAYLHGGGFVVGVLGSQWRWVAEVLLQTEMAAVVIQYDTFPKSRAYLSMVQQCLTVLEKMFDRGDLGTNWVLAGDSAGGSLALSVLSEALKSQISVPTSIGILLMSPWTKNEDWPTFTNSAPYEDLILDVRWLNWMAAKIEHSLPDINWGNLRGSDFSVLIQAGTREVFLPGARNLKQVLHRAGVHYVFHEEPDAVHAYPLFVGSEQATAAIRQQVKWLQSLTDQ